SIRAPRSVRAGQQTRQAARRSVAAEILRRGNRRALSLAEHQHFVLFDRMRGTDLWRRGRKAESLQQPTRARILALEDGGQGAPLGPLDELRDHRAHRLTREAAAPVRA